MTQPLYGYAAIYSFETCRVLIFNQAYAEHQTLYCYVTIKRFMNLVLLDSR